MRYVRVAFATTAATIAYAQQEAGAQAAAVAHDAPTVTTTPSADPPDTTPDGVYAVDKVESHADDPTGGGYTSPTLLYVPAVSLPRWTVRTVLSTDIQTPSDIDATVRPGVAGEVGLPGRVTLGAGTNWVGGDVNKDSGKTDFNLGLSPFFQVRLQLAGAADGRGWQLGTAITYKFVGFEGDPGEAELGLSTQYRHRQYEIGLQGVLGKDFASTDADAELHAYAIYRPLPQLGLGAAGQLRVAIVSQEGQASHDAVVGAIANLTLHAYQVGVLAGGSTIGLDGGRVAAMGQAFASVRF